MAAKGKKCRHPFSSQTTRGSNAYVRRICCQDCEKILYLHFYRSTDPELLNIRDEIGQKLLDPSLSGIEEWELIEREERSNSRSLPEVQVSRTTIGTQTDISLPPSENIKFHMFQDLVQAVESRTQPSSS